MATDLSSSITSSGFSQGRTAATPRPQAGKDINLTGAASSGSIRFTGLGSGSDFDSMITKLIEKEKLRTKRLQIWRSEWKTKSEEFDKLSAAMRTLNGTLQGMNTPDEFLIKKMASSNPGALTAKASSGAEENSHTVDIVSLAASDMHMGSAIFSSRDAVISGGGAGVFTFVYGGRQVSVDIGPATTLAQFADLINSDPDNRNLVRAGVINDGSGYRLQIRGLEPGAGNDFIVDDTLTTVPRFSSGDFIRTQKAGNAQLKVDGWPNSLTPTADVLKTTTSYTAPTDALGAGGTFRFAYNGAIHTVAVTAGQTLQQLADAITATGSGVTASTAIVNGKVELTLTGQPGSANQITIVNSPGTTLTGMQAHDFRQETGATDGYIERPGNTVSDVITGVELNLAKAGESVTLAASLDSEAVTERVRTFVKEVNDVLGLIRDQTRVTSVGERTSGSILTGNYGVQMIQQRLKSILAQKGLGFDYDLDPLVSLASVGIITDSSEGSPTFGLLTFDEGTFASALRGNPDAVARIFSADYTPSAKEIVNGQAVEAQSFRVESFIQGVTRPGDFDISYTISGGVIAAVPPPTINGQPANIDGNKLVAAGGGNLARGLSIEVVRLVDGSYSGQAHLKAGKAEELSQELKKLTDPLAGPLEILKDNYQDIMDAIDSKIAYEERRLNLLEKTMRQRFANLEALLGRYDKISSQLKSQIGGLGGGSK